MMEIDFKYEYDKYREIEEDFNLDLQKVFNLLRAEWLWYVDKSDKRIHRVATDELCIDVTNTRFLWVKHYDGDDHELIYLDFDELKTDPYELDVDDNTKQLFIWYFKCPKCPHHRECIENNCRVERRLKCWETKVHE